MQHIGLRLDFNFLSVPIAQSVIYFDYVEAIWEDLHNRFSQGGLLRVVELQEQIYGLKQRSISVTRYHTALWALWEEHDTYCSVKPCICPTRTYHDQNFIIWFLKGLNNRFSIVESQILLLEPPLVCPPPGRSRGCNTNGGRGGAKKLCVYCGRTGHTIDECYGKHGYPPGHPRYLDRPQFNDRSSSYTFYTNAATANPNSPHQQQLSITGSSKEETYPTSEPSL
ncbi:uncharacterized protein [Arachis hypogaea]|uniref:uncharacterized protein n=1 Tax=Arachis hypogaea TaxID=3818 RepID=UPI003B211C1A